MSRGGWCVLLGIVLVGLVAAFFWQLYQVNEERLIQTVYLEMPLVGVGPRVDLFDVILYSAIYGCAAGILLTLLFTSAVLASQDRRYRRELRGLKEQLLQTKNELAQLRGEVSEPPAEAGPEDAEERSAEEGQRSPTE